MCSPFPTSIYSPLALPSRFASVIGPSGIDAVNIVSLVCLRRVALRPCAAAFLSCVSTWVNACTHRGLSDIAQLPFRNDGRATSRNAGQCLPKWGANSGRGRPKLTKFGAISAECLPKLVCQNHRPTTHNFGTASDNIGQLWGRKRPNFGAELGHSFGRNLCPNPRPKNAPGIGHNIGPESTAVGPKSRPSVTRLRHMARTQSQSSHDFGEVRPPLARIFCALLAHCWPHMWPEFGAKFRPPGEAERQFS